MGVREITKNKTLPARKVQGVIQRSKEWLDMTALMRKGKEASVRLPPGFCGLTTPVPINSFRVALWRWAEKNRKEIGKYDIYVVDGTIYAVREDKY